MNSLDFMQAPSYLGSSRVIHQDAPNEGTPYLSLNPAPGSVDLIEPRNARGQAGVNEGLILLGPNTGELRPYADLNTWIGAFPTDQNGPNKGGQDYNIGRALAYQNSQLEAITLAQSAAATAQ